MRALIKQATVASALAIIGTTGAQASVIAPNVAGGSEAVLWVIRNSDSSAVAQDLGKTIGQINAGDAVNLNSLISGFISGSGGLGGVLFSVTAADTTTSGTSPRTYLTTLATSTAPTIKNGVINGTWNSAITNSSVSALNNGDATPTATNNAYGAYPNTDLTNPTLSGFTLWGSATDNTGAGNADLYLFKYVAGTAITGNAAVSALYQDAQVRLTADQLQFLPSAVPVPAAAWLFGSAIGLLGLARRKSA